MEQTKGNRPDYIVSTPRESGDKTFWSDVGVAFKTKNGKGINVLLNANPINGKLLVRKNEPKVKVEEVL